MSILKQADSQTRFEFQANQFNSNTRDVIRRFISLRTVDYIVMGPENSLIIIIIILIIILIRYQ